VSGDVKDIEAGETVQRSGVTGPQAVSPQPIGEVARATEASQPKYASLP
jgi:hypothetical protein